MVYVSVYVYCSHILVVTSSFLMEIFLKQILAPIILK